MAEQRDPVAINEQVAIKAIETIEKYAENSVNSRGSHVNNLQICLQGRSFIIIQKTDQQPLSLLCTNHNISQKVVRLM